ncbi:hypothetical protein NJ959_10330 [Symplocastrum sp. BBK-W-15]|uniref:Uncharacterized protein n=1 Tax=Limnofasciculus baicalensis BBK-W-15 TaxID=2699891 RepID=A0AAE3GQF9_9CYAN|nr:hypothetical protein [Limnofasciculus baicalensis BBK-W-15]
MILQLSSLAPSPSPLVHRYISPSPYSPFPIIWNLLAAALCDRTASAKLDDGIHSGVIELNSDREDKTQWLMNYHLYLTTITP